MNPNEIKAKAEADIASALARIDETCEACTAVVMSAFAACRVAENMFAPSTGYAYGDRARQTLDSLFAASLGAPAALVRGQFINGTHAIACALYGSLRAGQTLLCATGLPYDTLMPVLRGPGGSLAEYGVGYSVTELEPANWLDRLAADAARLRPAAALIQRSRGYSSRRALTVAEINAAAAAIKARSPETRVIVDNCYGEFTESREPDTFGAVDLICGSLIKNPGGGLAPTGGYVAGKPEAVEDAACRLGVPGIGSEAGCNPSGYRLYYQGLFMAPHTVAQALKTAVFAARALELAGFHVSPRWDEPRPDIIQTVSFGAPEPMLAFMRGIQAGSPVDSFVTPEPWAMPGYEDEVVMAAGAFVQGASIELSADGPMRPPYTAYLQGGLTYESGRRGVMKALEEILK